MSANNEEVQDAQGYEIPYQIDYFVSSVNRIFLAQDPAHLVPSSDPGPSTDPLYGPESPIPAACSKDESRRCTIEKDTFAVVLRKPTLPSKDARRKLVSLLDSISLEEKYGASLDHSFNSLNSLPNSLLKPSLATPGGYSSSPDLPGESEKSSRIRRIKPVKRGDSLLSKQRPYSWTNLLSLAPWRSPISSLEELPKLEAGSFVFVFEGE